MNNIDRLLTFLIGLGLSLPTVLPVLAQTSPPAPENLKTTEALLSQVCDFLKAQPAFTVETDVTYDNVLESGEKVQYSGYQELWVSKPDRMRSDYTGDERITRFYYDGQSFSLFTPPLDVYATKEAPANLDDVVEQIAQRYGITIPMSNLLLSNPCGAIATEIENAVFVGNNLVNRQETYHILLKGEERDIQLWISKTEPPLILKGIINYKTLPSSPQYTALFSNWNFNPSLTDDIFRFVPPQDAVGIEILPSQSNEE
ncbi:hypothetical protein cce_0190 [Crocosphaera subtropica ATCC 51142]|uniref:DUF2092 domain-containing protein n=1 Tax=Crocosphaera subtropica (strain ATCC 51142 / BH68) TaxID=43989 RepID=B1X041_CROS5|nr:DUF2092 domain-containing protein [Crocosphaera subtropica]ACB49542.1 hypothetical protein cce_0190 [Crocosphaera subtropica ATCC 51142]